MHLQHFVNNAVLSYGIMIEENVEIDCYLQLSLFTSVVSVVVISKSLLFSMREMDLF